MMYLSKTERGLRTTELSAAAASPRPQQGKLRRRPSSSMLFGRRVSKLFGSSSGSGSSSAVSSPVAIPPKPPQADEYSRLLRVEQERRRRVEEEKRRRLRAEAAEVAAAAAAAEAERLAPVEVASARANQVMALKDGRHLSFAEAGDPQGFPVLCFFGIGGSRYLVLLLDEVAKSLRLRVISPDRPGFGRSSLKGERRFADFAQDVDALCEALKLERIGLWGYSVGCAYVAVCALSERLRRRIVTRLTLISPWIPLNAPGVPMHFTLAKFFPRSVGELLRPNDIAERRAELKRRGSRENALSDLGDDLAIMSAPSARLTTLGIGGSERGERSDDEYSPQRQSISLFLCGGALTFGEADEPDVEDGNELTEVELRALETLPRGPRVLLASIIEAQRQGSRGFSDEFKLCCSEFGFNYADLKWPTRVFHGTDDNLVSSASVRWLVSAIRTNLKSNADVELFQVLGGTHNGMVFAILKRSLSAIAADIANNDLARRGYGQSLDDDEDDDDDQEELD